MADTTYTVRAHAKGVDQAPVGKSSRSSQCEIVL